MYNVSSAFKVAIKSPSRELRTKATCGTLNLTSSDILTIVLNEAVNFGEEFVIGTATSSSIEISINNVGDIRTADEFENKEITPYVGVILPDTTVEYVPLGIFMVEEALNDKNVINLKGFDRMIKFEVPYVTNLAYPATLLSIAQEICSLVGVTLATTAFANANYVVTLKPELTGVTCRKAIAWIAELAGGFARISRDGKLEIVTLTATDLVITKDNYYKLTKKDNPEIIDKVIVKTSEEQASAGAGTNVYYVSNNLFAQTPSTAVQGVYNVLNGLNFYPLETEWQGNPALQAGDKFTIDGLTSIVANQTITFKGGMRGKIKATGVSRTAKEYRGEHSLQIIKEQLKAEILIKNDEIVSRVSKTETDVQTAQSTADSAKSIANTKASQTDIDNSINAIQVGGRNLFQKSMFPNAVLSGVVGYAYNSEDYINGFTVVGQNNNRIGYVRFNNVIKENGTYTISFKFRGTQSVGIAVKVNICGNVSDVLWSNTLNTYKTLSFTTTVSNYEAGVNDFVQFEYLGWAYNRFEDIMLEKGNKATDWTPAPEDVQDSIDVVQDNINGVNEDLSTRINSAETEIQQTKDQISMKAEKTVTDELGNVVEQHSTQISTLNNQFNVEITRIDGDINGVKGDMTEVKSYMHFDENGLTLGKSNSPMQVSISNTELDFLDNGKVVAYVNGQKMYIDSLEVLSSLIVGQHKIEKYDDNITLVRWVGGN